MLSEAKHLWLFRNRLADNLRLKAWPRPEAFRAAALQLRFAQNDTRR
jgi:hypothetical protein